MTLRLFTIALLISAVPWVAMAESAGMTLNSGDFLSAKSIQKNGETLVSVRLSKSGKAKFKKLNQAYVQRKIQSDIAGVSSELTLREPIKGNDLQMGPFSESEAHLITEKLNSK